MTIMAGVVAALVWLASVTPTSMVPNEDQGYGLGVVFLDDGASQQRVDKVVELVEKFAEEEKQNIEGTVVINGFDILSSSVKSNYATFFFSLQPWEQRKGADQSVDAIMNRLLRLNAIQPSGVVLGFVPPPISGMSTTGGFEGYVQKLYLLGYVLVFKGYTLVVRQGVPVPVVAYAALQQLVY